MDERRKLPLQRILTDNRVERHALHAEESSSVCSQAGGTPADDLTAGQGSALQGGLFSRRLPSDNPPRPRQAIFATRKPRQAGMAAPTRADQRSNNQLRPLSGEPGVLSRADGSARFSHDKTEVLVAVYAPTEVKRARERLDAATIEVIVRPRAGLPGPVERELEQLLISTLEPCLITALHPRTAVSIVVQITHDDGGLLSAALNGTCVALMHAGVPMRGMLTGCCIALMPSGDALLDPTLEEQQAATAARTDSSRLVPTPTLTFAPTVTLALALTLPPCPRPYPPRPHPWTSPPPSPPPSPSASPRPSLHPDLHQAAEAVVTYGIELRQRADDSQATERRLLLSRVQGRMSQTNYDLCLRAARQQGQQALARRRPCGRPLL